MFNWIRSWFVDAEPTERSLDDNEKTLITMYRHIRKCGSGRAHGTTIRRVVCTEFGEITVQSRCAVSQSEWK